MKDKLLRPGQIIALRDYPVRNEQILKIYFRIYSEGQGGILPPCPVIHKSSGIPHSDQKGTKARAYNALLETFLKGHPGAEYFLLDGNHKTCAATLAFKPIPALVMEKDRDFQEAKELAKKGEIFGWHKVDKSMKDAVRNLATHHFGTKRFMTVEEKTKYMIDDGKFPRYMVTFFRKKTI